MNYFDTSRPQSSGQGCWMNTLTVLPDPYLRPLSAEDWLISVMTKVDSNSFRWLEIEIHGDQILDFLNDWRESPEETLQRWFETDPPVEHRAAKVQRPLTITLEDLNL